MTFATPPSFSLGGRANNSRVFFHIKPRPLDRASVFAALPQAGAQVMRLLPPPQHTCARTYGGVRVSTAAAAAATTEALQITFVL